jgi:hypothetical protein
MNNSVVPFDPSKFAATVANMAKGAFSQVGFMRMDKTGAWSYGTDETPIGEDDKVYVDPMGFVHGWQCWADTDRPGVDAELLGDIIVPMFEPMPEHPTAVPQNGREWAEARGMSVLLDGHKLVYTTTSKGGCGAIAGLAEAYAVQYRKDPTRMIAVLRLTSDSYKHKNKTYGKIYVPQFDVVDWVATLPQAAQATPAPEPEQPPPAAKPARKARARA